MSLCVLLPAYRSNSYSDDPPETATSVFIPVMQVLTMFKTLVSVKTYGNTLAVFSPCPLNTV